MKFTTDENVPVQVADLLRNRSHDAATVQEQELRGEGDSDLIEACRREGRIFVTLDDAFRDLRRLPPGSHPGILTLQPERQSIRHVLSVVKSAIEQVEHQGVNGELWTLGPRPGRYCKMTKRTEGGNTIWSRDTDSWTVTISVSPERRKIYYQGGDRCLESIFSLGSSETQTFAEFIEEGPRWGHETINDDLARTVEEHLARERGK